jgi:DNA repair protein RecO (recombination protein O)
LFISASGKTELLTLSRAEASAKEYLFNPLAGAAAFYLNELLLFALQKYDPQPQIFFAYQNALNNLLAMETLEAGLRQFEKILLKELGYALDLRHDAENHALLSHAYYEFFPGRGFLRQNQNHYQGLLGADILAFAEGNYQRPEILRAAKMITSKAIDQLVNYRPLKTRGYLKALINISMDVSNASG